MREEEARKRLETEPDFIALRRFNFSLKELEERYPDGCPAHVAAAALKLSREEVEVAYATIIQKLQHLVGAHA